MAKCTIEVIDALHTAVQAEFGCDLRTIVGMSDNAEKFVTVFILAHYYGMDARSLAIVYKLPVPYVATVVKRVSGWYAAHPSIADMIHGIMDAAERMCDVKNVA